MSVSKTMTVNNTHCYAPDWPAPARVKSLQTTRHGGVSTAPYDSFNLGDHVGDATNAVATNRQQLPSPAAWLKQTHSTTVVDAAAVTKPIEADASVCRSVGVVSVVMTADCLPVLLCDQHGTVVAAAHAGWRGLCDGIIEATIDAMDVPADTLMAWLGPAIGPTAFEVGDDVRNEFVRHDAAAASAFTAQPNGKWLGNMYQLARQRLNQKGVVEIYGGTECTVSNSEQYFSYRRDGVTGRMASLIWLE
ncbi:peptidoglycan editing factor PgeF [Deefgea tanakiae]|uniref:Purine nucleoside phosphorylase n=1 Tax=Deefgea tanakiae TaxID=2865840 RepID=A0ABX8Z3E2_9NEIS|nr:peptidoglycan editing factor PgeF [Deefgea tanakiae]QZA76885.1 peptidoglycan editing factor PgeF [Deefgea tanakiae]